VGAATELDQSPSDSDFLQERQAEFHERIVEQEPTAFAELCQGALPHLVAFLRREFSGQDPHLHETVAIDLLLDYQRRPEQYDPQKLSLLAYLRMAARRDMLNAIDKQTRRQRKLASLDDPLVELQAGGRNNIQEAFELDEWLQQHTDLSLQEILERLSAELDETDERVLLLMLEGVRETARYADVMGLEWADAESQRRDVKRAKDRVMQKLRRFGERAKSDE
jgi:DNA-directed RNA polymerase specialized sigma24 family protein